MKGMLRSSPREIGEKTVILMDKEKAGYYARASGCLISIVGFILFFYWPIGTILGFVVMIIGKQMVFREPVDRSHRVQDPKDRP